MMFILAPQIAALETSSMDWLAFSLGLAGIIATTLMGVLGLYFNAKQRTAPLRENLYAKQFDHIVEGARLLGYLEVNLRALEPLDEEATRAACRSDAPVDAVTYRLC